MYEQKDYLIKSKYFFKNFYLPALKFEKDQS